MLHLELLELELCKEGEQLIKRLHRRLEKELFRVPGARILCSISQKNRSKFSLVLRVFHGEDKIFEEESSVRCWKNALDLYVTHATWLLKSQVQPVSQTFRTY